MKTAKLYRISEWQRNGERLPVSTFSLPTGFDPATDKIVKTDRFGWYLPDTNTYHAKPGVTSRDDVAAFLTDRGYTIVH